MVLYFWFVTKTALVTHWCFHCCSAYLHSFLFPPFSIPQIGQGGQEAEGTQQLTQDEQRDILCHMASCSAIKMNNAINGFGGVAIPRRLAGHWSTLGGEWIELLNGGCFLFVSLSFIYQTVFIHWFSHICLLCFIPYGEQMAGWSTAAGWGQLTTPPLVSLKKQNSDEDNEQKFRGKRSEQGGENPFPCSESREHYEINIWWLFQTTGHVRTTRSQLRFRGWKECLTAALLHSEEGLGCLLVDLARLFHLLTALS